MSDMTHAMNTLAILLLIHSLLWLPLKSSASGDTYWDLLCLKNIKESLKDPFNHLSSWDFHEGLVCNFVGIECSDDRVSNIRLADKGLEGQFPGGLEDCTELESLDLSNNKLSGTIPSDICEWLPWVKVLNLSSNNFSGEIPSKLQSCSHLSVLKLDNNQLTGRIPLGNIFPRDSYANNPGLCGEPLDVCEGQEFRDSFIRGFIGGWVGGFLSIVSFFLFRLHRVYKKKEEDRKGNKLKNTQTGSKDIKISTLLKYASRMKLSDLMKATNNFGHHNIIGSGRMGIMYKGMLPDGLLLVVKRLQDAQHLDERIVSELRILRRLKHCNLVPLLGFCINKKEKLLGYKYMPNGNLRDWLHPPEIKDKAKAKFMEWPQRLRVAIGLARGLAWLHYNSYACIIHCNISSKCVLLDENFKPMISNLRRATFMNLGNSVLTMSNLMRGEFGELVYVAPEYEWMPVPSPKGDVYSFGTVLLELVTGEKPNQVSNASERFRGTLVEWVTYLSNSYSGLYNAVDKSLIGQGFDDDILHCLRIACNCVLRSPKQRPTMFKVYQILRAIGERYYFIEDNKILMPPDIVDADYRDEIMKSQIIEEIQ